MMWFVALPVVFLGSVSAIEPAAVTADEALQKLVDGNRRYVGRPKHPHQGAKLRHALAAGQHPFAAVLSCADSRVPPELVFDEGLGDLFVVRVAGNIADDAVIGSLEYAAEHLHVPLVVVLGHKKCGAVTAAASTGEAPRDHVKTLVEAIKPAIEQARGNQGDLVENAIVINVRRTLRQLRTSQPTLAHLEHAGKLRLAGAIYDIDSGRVEWIHE